MKLKFEIENCSFLTKFVLISSFRRSSYLYSYLRLQTHAFYLLQFRAKQIFEKYKMAAKMVDMLLKTVAIATVLN